ncbi:hypothetical protein [Mycoplasma tauri]|uniref:Lipoprotein n=1 Tax=Mycoplasma tauri TaxID=547987 RepID=A0A953NE60_9MOLU|nr:hypothetical protein [Mycoplasma tauri]MBZ4195307.1 hypothetical protein [Mycoplasma tauri]MBZ4212882.1 hypothetical protein [Mycoplasma tauri]MBZ4218304.1 hypothetical protein [Mycoplasma tauri]
MKIKFLKKLLVVPSLSLAVVLSACNNKKDNDGSDPQKENKEVNKSDILNSKDKQTITPDEKGSQNEINNMDNKPSISENKGDELEKARKEYESLSREFQEEAQKLEPKLSENEELKAEFLKYKTEAEGHIDSISSQNNDPIEKYQLVNEGIRKGLENLRRIGSKLGKKIEFAKNYENEKNSFLGKINELFKDNKYPKAKEVFIKLFTDIETAVKDDSLNGYKLMIVFAKYMSEHDNYIKSFITEADKINSDENATDQKEKKINDQIERTSLYVLKSIITEKLAQFIGKIVTDNSNNSENDVVKSIKAHHETLLNKIKELSENTTKKISEKTQEYLSILNQYSKIYLNYITENNDEIKLA